MRSLGTAAVLFVAVGIAGLVLWSRMASDGPEPNAVRPATVVGTGSPADFGDGEQTATPFGDREPPTSCAALPTTVGRAPWLPADLPVPATTRMGGELADGQGYRTALLAVPIARDRLTPTVRAYWADQGYALTHQEAESHEAEMYFTRATEIVAVRLRSTYCDKAWTELMVAQGTSPSS